MKRYLGVLLPISLLLASAGCASFPRADDVGAQVPRITKEELLSRMGNGGAEVIDVRRTEDWETSPLKITGARREIPEEVPTWSKNYPKKTPIVLYCA